MGHREAAGHDFARFDIHHHATIPASLAPAIGGIGVADGGHVGGLAIAHRQAIEMAAIFRRQA
jgi:hypothetical protein